MFINRLVIRKFLSSVFIIFNFLIFNGVQADTFLYFNSEEGDYIGRGEVHTWTEADGTFSATRNPANGVDVNFENTAGDVWWNLSFAAPDDVELTVSSFEGATRYPFQEVTEPGLDVGGSGRGCNTLSGRFDVLEIVYGDGETISSFAADFEQLCGGASTGSLKGSIYFNSSIEPANSQTLTVSKQGSGKVTASTGLGSGIDCGTTCTEDYETGATVALNAIADPGMVFSNWEGDCSGVNYVTTVTMDSAKSCTAIFQVGVAGNAMRAGFDQNELEQNDDASTTSAVPLGFAINFFGVVFNGVYVNNNGNITFGQDLFSYSPSALSGAGVRIIAPFWADVDTRGGGTVTYGTGTVDGRPAFGVNWNQVGYFDRHWDRKNTFQVILIDRSDLLAGAFDIELNYDSIEWETGDDVCPSCEGTTGGYGGFGEPSARVGYSNGSTVNFELEGSAVAGTMVDGGENALAENSLNSNVIGRYRLLGRGDEVMLEEPEILSVQTAGGGTGTITSDPAGIDCGETCSKIFERDSVITLTATPDADSEFKGWSGDSDCSDGSVTLSTTTNCIATFAVKPTFTFPLPSSGTISISPAGENCGVGCTYHNTGIITLTAVPDVEYRFTGWGGDCTGSDNPLTLNINSDTHCTATFTQIITKNLTLTKEGLGSGTINTAPAAVNTCGDNCSKFEQGSTVTLTAVPERFSLFTGWSGDDCSGSNPSVTVTMNAAKNCVANFIIQTFDLSLAFEGNGTGKVTSDPAGIDCTSNCSGILNGGATVNLTAIAPVGSRFSEWGGDCSGGQVFMDGNKNCTVRFIRTGKPKFVTTNNRVQENAGVAIIGVSRIEGSEGQLSVKYSTADGTATVDEDYRGRSGILTWTADDLTDKTFSVPLLADVLSETNETVLLTLYTLNDEVIETATLTIVNVLMHTEIQFISPETSVIEYEGMKQLLVTRAANSNGQVLVDYSTTNASAIAGEDYQMTSGTLTWADGDSDPKVINVPIIIDSQTETQENLTVALSNLRMDDVLGNPSTLFQMGAVFGNPSTVSLVIHDSIATDSSRLQFPSANYAVDENSGTAVLTVERAGSALGQVSVHYSTQDGSAMAGSDYVSQNDTLIWDDGDSRNKTISIPILTDSEAESEETIIVQLSNPNGVATLGTIDHTVLKILDETGEAPASSPGILKFSEMQYTVSENVGNVTVNVERFQGTTGEISVSYLTKNGIALVEEDYSLTEGILTWADGENGVKSFDIPILTDGVAENQENFTVILLRPTGNASLLAGAAVAIVNINDRDSDDGGGDDEPSDNPAGVLQFDIDNYSVMENGGSVSASVTRLGGSQGIVSVDYNTQNETAIANSDYIAEQGTLTWLDGESGSKSFTVSVLDNGAPEPQETVILRLSNPQGGATLGEQAQAILRINDNDGFFVKFSSNVIVEDESSTYVTVGVQREGDALGQISVHYQTVDDMSGDSIAIAGEDYESTTGTLTWQSGDISEKTFTIALISDNIEEGNESIYVRLFSPEGARLLEPSEAEIKLLESDSGECTVGTEINCYYVNTGILTDVSILSQGTVVGGKIAGEISSEGVVENVMLDTYTKLIGGIVNGKTSTDPDDIAILSDDPNYPNNLAIIDDADIAANSILSNIVIGYNTRVSNNVVLGKGVLFKNNVSIPSVDLATVLGRKEMSVFGLHAIDLTKDVLFSNVIEGILTAINGLHEFASQRIQISQALTQGILSTRIDNLLYTALPIHVKQKAIVEAALGDLGLKLDFDDKVTFVTHTGRQVIAQPVIQDPNFFEKSLKNTFKLEEIAMLPNGNLKVPNGESSYYIGRPNLFATRVEKQPLGVSINADGNVAFVYQDDSFEFWMQIIYPVSADAEAFYNYGKYELNISDFPNGQASIKFIEGENWQIYKGVFDFVVEKGEPLPDKNLRVVLANDRNGDGHEDYKIIYPNGDRQILFALPQE